MLNLIKKDLLTLSKNRNELIELLVTPFFLLTILGFALGNIMNSSEPQLETSTIGLVNHQNFQENLDMFRQELSDEGIPEETINTMMSAAESMDPTAQLLAFFDNKEVEQLIEVQQFDDASSADSAIEEDEISGIIEIPDQFSYQVWNTLLLEEESTANLKVTVQDLNQTRAVVLDSLVSNFVEEYNLQSSIAAVTGSSAPNQSADVNYGEVIQLSTEEPINSFQYYTVGMGVFYALSVGSTIAIRAFKEKEQHVFARIMLSNQSPLAYLTSKLLSGTLIAFLQLSILFVLSTLIFGTFSGKPIDFWINTFTVTLIYSLLVGSIASILTSVSLNGNNDTTVGFFSSFIAVLAFLGGSFTPVDTFSETIKALGNWTPNGAALTSYLQLMMGFDLTDVMPLLTRIIGMAICLIIGAVIVFPKGRLD